MVFRFKIFDAFQFHCFLQFSLPKIRFFSFFFPRAPTKTQKNIKSVLATLDTLAPLRASLLRLCFDTLLQRSPSLLKALPLPQKDKGG